MSESITCERFPDAEHRDDITYGMPGRWVRCWCGRWRRQSEDVVTGSQESREAPVPVLCNAILDAIGGSGIYARKMVIELTEDWDCLVYVVCATKGGQMLEGLAKNVQIVKNAVVTDDCVVVITPFEGPEEISTHMCICGHPSKDHRHFQPGRHVCTRCYCGKYSEK